MAGHLVNAGHDVHVFNRTHAKSEQWAREYNGTAHDSPASAAHGCDFVFTCVGNDKDVEEVIMGSDGVLSTLAPNSIIVDHTTASVTIAQDVNQRTQEAGIGFIDAPISGGQSGAEQGILSIMCGGAEDHFEKALPVMGSYGKTMTLIGPSGSGQFTKMEKRPINDLYNTLLHAAGINSDRFNMDKNLAENYHSKAGPIEDLLT